MTWVMPPETDLSGLPVVCPICRQVHARCVFTAGSERGRASVDVELVALGVGERNRVVVLALLEFLAQVAEQRGAEVVQPPGLGVHALPAALTRRAHRELVVAAAS